MLSRSQPLRRTPLKRTAMRRAQRRRITQTFRDALCFRSGGWCEPRLDGCLGRATDVCHRIARKAGGRPQGRDIRLSNVWHGCRACHQWATERPAEAYDAGLALKEGQDTTVEPIAFWNGWMRLDDEGFLWPA